MDSELDSFRQKWILDLRSKSAGPAKAATPPDPKPRPTQVPRTIPDLSGPSPPKKQQHQLARSIAASATLTDDGDSTSTPSQKTPVSALEHYELAVEKEVQGSLGDSLRLYRQAFKLDDRVDQKYSQKHFPTHPQTAPPPPHSKPITSPTPPQPIPDLIASFAHARLTPAPPAIEGDPPPPCPLARLPDELLMHILQDVAVLDVATYARLSAVCKRLAFLVATEQAVWRRVCVGAEFGFAAMVTDWQCDVHWRALAATAAAAAAPHDIDRDDDDDDDDDDDNNSNKTVLSIQLAAPPPPYRSWRGMFRHAPRLRFGGCYISTVNYMRNGEAGIDQRTWATPVHIVTYYRYLRFFRDGAALSLLTTADPADVVPLLTRDALEAAASRSSSTTTTGGNTHAGIMGQAHRARWRMGARCWDSSSEASTNDTHRPPADARDAEQGEKQAAAAASVFVETEGVVRKYMYRMELTLTSARSSRSSSRAQNTRLAWRRFYYHDWMTDDWGEFRLVHHKPFIFSRVRSYGVLGE